MDTRRQRSVALGLVIGAVVVASVFLSQAREPETVTKMSSDGRVQLSGESVLGDASMVVATASKEPAPMSFLLTPAYGISAPVGASSPFRLTFNYKDGEWNNAPVLSMTLYRFQQLVAAWQPIPSEVDMAKHAVSSLVRLEGESQWSLGRTVDIALPLSALGDVDLLRSAPPAEAVGYRAFASFAPSGEDFVLVRDQLDTGGCDGRFVQGDVQSVVSKERPVEDEGVWRIGIVWETKQGGCSNPQKISSTRRSF